MDKQFEIVLIEWLDTCSDSGWQEITNLKDLNVLHIFTVGYLIEQDEKQVKVARDISDSKPVIDAPVAIPRACIKSIKSLFPMVEHGGME